MLDEVSKVGDHRCLIQVFAGPRHVLVAKRVVLSDVDADAGLGKDRLVPGQSRCKLVCLTQGARLVHVHELHVEVLHELFALLDLLRRFRDLADVIR